MLYVVIQKLPAKAFYVPSNAFQLPERLCEEAQFEFSKLCLSLG
jgi:hypothetical protein